MGMGMGEAIQRYGMGSSKKKKKKKKKRRYSIRSLSLSVLCSALRSVKMLVEDVRMPSPASLSLQRRRRDKKTTTTTAAAAHSLLLLLLLLLPFFYLDFFKLASPRVIVVVFSSPMGEDMGNIQTAALLAHPFAIRDARARPVAQPPKPFITIAVQYVSSTLPPPPPPPPQTVVLSPPTHFSFSFAFFCLNAHHLLDFHSSSR